MGAGKTPETYTSQQINLARFWAEAGHYVHLITSQREGVYEALRHKRIRVFIRPSLWLVGKKRIPLILLGGWRQIWCGDYDIIFSSEHYQPATALACLLSSHVIVYQGQNTEGSSTIKKVVFRF